MSLITVMTGAAHCGKPPPCGRATYGGFHSGFASDSGALGETVRTHGLGHTYGSTDPDGLDNAIRRASRADARALVPTVEAYAAAHAWPRVAGKHARLYSALSQPARAEEAA